jgi:hypothetical protein
MSSSVTATFLDASAATADFLGSPAVAAAWDRPSALAEFAVSGLAGHLARQVTQVPVLLAQADDSADNGHETISALEHYRRISWIGAALDADVNVSIRRGSDAEAVGGPVGLAKRTEQAAAELRATLPATPPERRVFLPQGPWCLTLDDYLTTRLLEIVIHTDDLAVSVGAQPPDLPEEATDTVLTLLTRIAASRLGPETVLRAFARKERAPASIAVF